MEFKVKGVTFENEEGKDIQKILKKEIKELKEAYLINEEYEGYTNTEIKEMDLNVQQYSDVVFDVKIKEDVFEEKTCVKIYIQKNDGNYVHVGYMPKKLLKEYKTAKEDDVEIKGTAKLTGGKYKHCRYYENEEYEEVAEVETIELDYGLLVNLDLGYGKNNSHENGQTSSFEEYYNNLIKEEKKDAVVKHSNTDTSNIIVYVVIGIICIPFIWLTYKIFSFILWLFN